ncbi:PREDICTED: late embryogenesis abundant protein 1-like [Nicotiana attenuata]|uniref:late embryogenesis abundant protein 1-like n=1 Tax=Nicotiana attenuata TaxID=49451 RepID=UPI0009058D6F|nr:PREDICTED: late embryogenesis abundant protein 1-like [Nicotiana attenuata]
MASAQFNVDQSHDQAEAKTEQWTESANSSVNKIEDAIQRARESAQQKREQNSGFLHQTGEQMMHMAQGAVDGVKNTLGIGSNKNK